jgi:hypothetical protein
METPKESDQLPEDAPAEVVHEDDEDAARPEAYDSPGVPGGDEHRQPGERRSRRVAV